VILSPDKDLSQCVREDGRVVTYDRRRQAFLDADGVRRKLGVDPESVPDYLALVGDAADGFPGLPGFGARTAAALLARYRHLEAIPRRAVAWDVSVRGPDRLAATLRERWGDALLFRELATVRTDAPIEERLEALAWRGVPRERFRVIVSELGAPHLLGRVPRWAD